MHSALTIAGSDSGGGAGIQADLKTFEAFGIFGLSVITALTAQNTLGVQGIFPIPHSFVKLQLQSIFSDFKPSAVKTGMLAQAELIEVIASQLKESQLPYVADPVMISTSGHRLLENGATEALCELLLPLATVITPNTDEVTFLTGIAINNRTELRKAGEKLLQRFPNATIILKGGHLPENAQTGVVQDFILNQSGESVLASVFKKDIITHGTGCTFSAAITAGLARGKTVHEATKEAKNYITRAIQAAPVGLGQGASPLKHNIK
jgi:hydroxymethylpyrimidine/phosphomethylpyrimidine kinase